MDFSSDWFTRHFFSIIKILLLDMLRIDFDRPSIYSKKINARRLSTFVFPSSVK